MPISVPANTISGVDRRQQIEAAVLAGIGSRRQSEIWTVRIYEPATGLEYIVKIEGPNGFNWERTFWGPEEEAPEFIRSAVADATR
jgi:hypothetical protein